MPIKRKVTLVILFTCSVIVLLACAGMGGYQIVQYRLQLVRSTSVLADVLARNTQAALAFHNESDAKETLRALEAEPYVTAACLYSSDDTLFADYSRLQAKAAFPEKPPADGYHFESGALVVASPVTLNEKRIGTILLRANLQGIYDRLKWLAIATGLVLLGCGWVARVLASRLQRNISQPIVTLTEVVRAMAERKDYTVRLPERSRDETGLLTAAFNQLLASIEERDQALRGANESLRQSEAQLQAIFESLNDGLVVADTDGQVLSVNRAAMELHGFSSLDEYRRHFNGSASTFELSAAEGAAYDAKEWPLPRILQGETLRNLETRIRTREGQFNRVFLYGGTLVHDANGHATKAVLTIKDITDRKRAEDEIRALNVHLERRVQERTEKLRESQNSLAVTLQSIGDGVVGTDTDGRITRLNRVAEALTGWTQGEALGRPVSEVFRMMHAESRQPESIPIEQVVATGEIQSRTENALLVARDGAERPVVERASPIRDEAGGILGVVLVFRDVTEEQRAKQALQKSAAEYQDLYNNAPCGYHAVNTEGLFVAINDTELAWLGCAREEVIGKKTHRDFVSPETVAAYDAGLAIFKQTGQVKDMDIEWICKGGRRMSVLVNASAVRDANGQILHSRSTVHDITDRKKGELSVRQSNERTRSIIDTAHDAFIAIDVSGKIITWNTQAESTFGWLQSEAIGRGFSETLIPARYRQTPENGMNLFDVTEQAPARNQRLELTALHRDGREFPVEAAIWPIKIGETCTFNAFLRDVTERKRSEAAIQRLNTELHERADQLEAANKELEAFSYSVSHDLRAPLRHVQGYVELLSVAANGHLSPEARDHLKVISDASSDMAQLIDDLLAFSRTGRTEMRTDAVRLDDLVRDCIRSLEIATRGRNIVWKIAPLPAVVGDRPLLRQVFANLVGNAIKYSRPRDPAELQIGCAGEEDGRVVFFVRDNGVGFNMKYVAKLFGVFQRLHKASEFEGTGIGLAIVQRIIHRHGGRIWAEGTPDRGATFYFTLKSAASVKTPNEQNPKL